MDGPKGGGFIFDTNTVHKGGAMPIQDVDETTWDLSWSIDQVVNSPNPYGSQQTKLEFNTRTTIIMEFHGGPKVPYLHHFSPKHGLPCPSKKEDAEHIKLS